MPPNPDAEEYADWDAAATPACALLLTLAGQVVLKSTFDGLVVQACLRPATGCLGCQALAKLHSGPLFSGNGGGCTPTLPAHTRAVHCCQSEQAASGYQVDTAACKPSQTGVWLPCVGWW